jgi:hypothetical protein
MMRRGDVRALINATAEMWDWYSQQKNGLGDGIHDRFAHPAVIEVANVTGTALDRFSILQLTDPLFLPTAGAASLLSFQQGAALSGIVPPIVPDPNRWVITLDPIPAQRALPAPLFGRAAIAGAVACQVLVTNTSHQYCAPVGGQTGYLASVPSGPGLILSSSGQVGLQWCYVYLRCCSPVSVVGFNSGSRGVTGGCCPNGYAPTVCVTLPTGPAYPGSPWPQAITSIYAGIQLSFVASFDGLLKGPVAGCGWFGTAECESIFGDLVYVMITRALTSGGVLAWSINVCLGDRDGNTYECNDWGGPAAADWDCQSGWIGVDGRYSSPGELGSTAVVSVGDCAGGGGGGGGTGISCSCAGGCSGVGALTATYTDTVGAWTAMPDSATLPCQPVNAGADHAWYVVAGVATVFGQGQASEIACGSGSASGVPIFAWTDADGVGHVVECEAGNTCSPFSAVFKVDDGAGNTMTVTVIE